MYKSESRIIKEYEIMIRKLKIHIPVGQVLSEFAENVEQEDVDNFVTVFTTAQKSGGDSIVIIKDAVKVISEKMETEKEIQTMIASKKLEFEIMSMIPFGMIGYMKLTFGDFLKVWESCRDHCDEYLPCFIFYSVYMGKEDDQN